MSKIKMHNYIVEMDGDEMTRVLWQQIKDILLLPYVELKTKYFDLGLSNRDATDDQVTIDAANETLKCGVAVKCATITANEQRVKEYKLKKQWKSPNGTIRAILDGTVFRIPIMVKGIAPTVNTWKKPITIARHAYGDMYRDVEMKIPCAGDLSFVFEPEDKTLPIQKEKVFSFKTSGIAMGMHNIDNSIRSFARACFQYALETKQDLWFSTKDTISQKYDQTFKLIFEDVFNREYKQKFADNEIEYFYTLIDDAVARVIRSKGGFIWACKNYDGDVMSDMVATAFGSLAMMTSVLVSPSGAYEFEAAHGTVTRHYYKYLNGEETSTNPMATIFAWTGALRKRGELDDQTELSDFAGRLEAAALNTIECGEMTKDLFALSSLPNKTILTTENFLIQIASRL